MSTSQEIGKSRVRLVFVETADEFDALRYTVDGQTVETLAEAHKCQRLTDQAVQP